jgi:hypothetical protein
MFQVLEHMDNLQVLFQKLNWLMKGGGSLFIPVPILSRIEFNELMGALLDMPPFHIGRWNRKCFEEIGKQNGFHIEDYKVEESSLISIAKGFVVYRFLQNSQRSGSFENHIQKIKNRYLLIIMQMIGVIVNSNIAVQALAKINPRMGSSQ